MPIIGLPKRYKNSEISRYCGALIWPRYGLCEIARLLLLIQLLLMFTHKNKIYVVFNHVLNLHCV